MISMIFIIIMISSVLCFFFSIPLYPKARYFWECTRDRVIILWLWSDVTRKGRDTMSTGLEKRSTLRTFYNELRPRADALNHPIVICVAIEYEERRMVSRGKYHRPIDPMHLLHDLFPFLLSLFLSSLFFF